MLYSVQLICHIFLPQCHAVLITAPSHRVLVSDKANSLFLLWPKCSCYFSLIRAHFEWIYPQALASPTVFSLPINKLPGIWLATQSPLGVF